MSLLLQGRSRGPSASAGTAADFAFFEAPVARSLSSVNLTYFETLLRQRAT